MPADGGGVSLTKLTLTKAAPTVSLAKGSGATGEMRVNLNWNAGTKGLFRKAQSIDLDLGCLWELTDGSKGVVQALGNAFGRLDGPPYIRLDGDDRSGSASGGENLSINLEHLHQIRRVLVFAFIYEGVPAWSRADGVVTLYPQGAVPIELALDEHSGSRMCAVALLSSTGSTLDVRREIRYVDGSQQALDRMYGWGMDWRPGRK
jgi:tellurite resistance protein TerA